MSGHRNRRVADLLRAILGDLLTRETADRRLQNVRITGVDVSPDLRNATLRVSVFPGGQPEREEALLALTHATGWMRREIAARAGLRIVPSLRFTSDRTLERAARIDEVLREVEASEAGARDDDRDDD